MSDYVPNSFQVPNAVVDVAMRDLSDKEFKCLVLIIRKTRGWGKEFDAIAISQFKQFTGINRDKTIQKTLSNLIDQGLVVSKKTPGKMSEYGLSEVFNQGQLVPVAPSATSGTSEPEPVAPSATATGGTRCHPTKHTNTKPNTKGDDSPGGDQSGQGIREYPDWWEGLWAARPTRAGSDPQKAAYQAACARMKSGVTIEVLSDGLARYEAFCKATGKLDTETVMQLKRFFGPGEEYLESWTIPTDPGSTVKPVRARIPRDDYQLMAWASTHGYPPPGSRTYVQYRSFLNAEVEKRFNGHGR